MSDQNPSAALPETVISVRNLGKTFRDFWGRTQAAAVNGIDFDIHSGEVVGLLGPNGSGKSTTVKMLLGLLYPTTGVISVFGKSPRDVNIKKSIGYLPEDSYFYRYLTAAETLDFFGSLFNLSAADRKLRCEQLLEMVGLSHAANRKLGEFSKGMARRIGIAQAMINDPDLLILDEPTSGLDPIGCREVKDLILTLKSRGKTVLVTSHLLGDIEDICDRVIILYGGKIQSQGKLDELLAEGDRTRVTFPNTDPATMQMVVDILKKAVADGDIAIDHPHHSLEEFFLKVVNDAKSRSVATSGADKGGRIADYLNRDSAGHQEILDALIDKKVDAAPQVDEVVSQPESAADPDDAKISEKLARATEATPPPPEDHDDQIQDAEALAKAGEKLQELLNPEHSAKR